MSMKGKENSYDRHFSEAAYWTLCDAIELVSSATSAEQVALGLKIYNRFKFYV